MTAFVGASLTNTYTAAQLAGSENYATPQLGQVYDNLDKRYRFVLHNSGAGAVAAVAGNFCYYYAPGGVSTGVSTTVTSDLSDSANVGAGVWMAAPATGEYGWIQTRGVATLTTALTAGADGNALTAVGATDGTVDVSAAVTDHVCAIAIDASAKIVFLTCPT
ncbi:hypothetical protein FJV76_14290 [Mesorhizobium sp. WSM4303]|uniref:hypothetical protein n=1 Tax=Mesorhizobium sp. WSM4303 TaxID=2589887 RepID=UPI00115D1BE0|nr:hypothetical protein [Mesorhizobium sp. WSM4303]TRD03803.1 hypothetical protein FJV76_14290 [Mesorhizobium sp. WSM4303]